MSDNTADLTIGILATIVFVAFVTGIATPSVFSSAALCFAIAYRAFEDYWNGKRREEESDER